MKQINYLLLLLLLLSSYISFAQIGNWKFTKPQTINITAFNKLGRLHVNNNGILVCKKDKQISLSFWGDEIYDEQIEELPSLSALYDVYTRQIGTQTIRISAVLKINPNHSLILNASNPITQENNSLEIAHAAYFSRLFLFEANNGDFIIFGKNSIDTYRLEEDLSWSLIHTAEQNFEDISHIVQTTDNFLVSTPTGELHLLNTEYETIWTSSSNHPISYGAQSAGGFVVCGTEADTALVSKINSQGDLIWQESFANREAHCILALDNTLLIGGQDLYCIDLNGTFLWDRVIPDSEGIFEIKADPYNGVILKENNSIYRVDLGRSSHFKQHNSIHTSQTEADIASWGNLDYERRSIKYPLGAQSIPIYINIPVFTAQTEDGSLVGLLNTYNEEEYFNSLPQNTSIEDNRLWKITQKEINILQERFNNGEELAPFSHAMLSYPALGNPHCSINGVAYVIEEALAPFVDMNGDGIYNIFDGDYPEMKGDQMIWWAKRDTIYDLELHGCWYVYECGDHIVSNTVYVDYTLINKSTKHLSDARFGKFLDWDVGCPDDDFVGSFPSLNAVYAYNADAIDGDFEAECYVNIPTYGSEIPIHSLTFLNEAMASAIIAIRIGFIPFFPVEMKIPNSIDLLNHYMHGAFSDGTPLTRGGLGYNPDSTNITNYIFPDNPADPTGWSMASEDLSSADIRSITASNSFELAPNESKSFTFSFTTHPNIPHPAPDVSGVEANILAIDELYQAGNNFAPLHLGEDIMIQSGESIELMAGEEGMSYLWSTGETTASISIDTPDTYSVSLTDDNGCQRTDDIVVKLATTSTKELVNSKALMHIYPNPMRQGNTATIELEQAQHIASVHIFNTLGQQLSSQLIDDFSARIQVNELAQLPAGVYVLEVILKNNERQLGKLVIE